MKWLRRRLRAFATFLKDLFYGTDNQYADLARILAFVGVMTEVGGALWNVHLKKEINLGPNGLGGGMAAILTAAAAYLAAKAWSRKKNREGEQIATVAPPCAGPGDAP